MCVLVSVCECVRLWKMRIHLLLFYRYVITNIIKVINIYFKIIIRYIFIIC